MKLKNDKLANQHPPSPQSDLRGKSVKASIVNISAQCLKTGIQLVSTIVLARLLSPDDYGVMAIVMTVVSLASLFRDLGLSSAAIQAKELTHAQQSNLFWLNVMMGTILTATVAGCAPLIAWFFQRPELFWVTIALSPNFLIGSLGTQHGANLVRSMRFGRQAIATIVGSVIVFVVSTTLAIQGWGYWSLVWGGLSGGIATTISLIKLSKFSPSGISRGSGVRKMIGFGANVTMFDFVNYFQRNLDNILIGKFWGSTSLGFYSRAYSLLMLPITTIQAPIQAVALPTLSQLQNDPDRFRDYYKTIIFVIFSLTAPITVFLALESELVISVILGSQWSPSTEIFRILAIVAFIQPVASFRGTVLLALGQSRAYLAQGTVVAIVASLGFMFGVTWGPKGVAIGYATTTLILFVPATIWSFRKTPLSICDTFSVLLYPFLITLAAASATHLLSHQITNQPPVSRLAILVVFFGITYSIIFSINKKTRTFLNSLKKIKRPNPIN